ncbi:immunoglobulin-like domain-containing protein [Microbacterium sp. ZXX196]|uniref:immunoglobulin-like domain-containing protein n=1 Tax=Microbacterium sp. ZXX196 TaxID=2609291 RepID=UPI001329CE10|nr:immunoglobulin-like domain-containing protein [Microbacterium sp. ZXX196]MTE23913.1 carbohydrate-binding protein [Microbacterium sp. ZXX196]
MHSSRPAPPDGAARTARIPLGRRGIAGALLLTLSTGSLAAVTLPASAATGPVAQAASDGTVAEALRIEAESYTGNNGGGTKTETSTDAVGESLGNVGGTWDGAEISYDAVDFGEIAPEQLTVRYVNNSSRVGQNASLDFYLDDTSEANKLVTVDLPVTGSNWNAYDTVSVDLPAEVTGEHTLIVVMHATTDDAHPYVGNFDWFEFGPAPIELPDAYLDTDSTWRYSDNNTDPSGDGSLSWTLADFDDAAWKTGTGSFGSKRGAADLGGGFVANTLLTYTQPGSSDTVQTYHFRTDVDISAAELAEIGALDGTVTYDDAIRIYVNGEQVAGYEDGRVDEAANPNLTYAGNSNGNPITSSFHVPAELLHAGENTVSVALYQDRESSSDIYFDLSELAPVEAAAPAEISDVVLGVGETEAARNLAWYSNVDVAQVAQLAPAADVADGVFPASAATIEPSAAGGTSSGEFFRDVEFTDLAENTEYAYRVGSDDTGWSDVYTFRTQAFSGDFEFLFFGDPQVGASGNLANDEAGWVDTMNIATESYPDAEMIFSAGDQVNTASSEAEYSAFLAPEQLTSVPLVATNGNHDVGSKAYEQHFNLPNEDLTAGAASSGSSSGGDYWFIYKDVLFLNINSNSRDYASHNAFMEQVIAEHGDEATWKVLAFHHSIYSVASHAFDGDILDRRTNMPQTISELGFDVVLMGHDHNYTRSYLIENGELADAQEIAGQATVEAKDGEVLYLTANSASGSKYYNTTAPDAWYSSVMNQEKVRNYSVIEVTDSDMTLRTLRSEANGAESPVNSVVDEVVLTRDAAPELTVPADGEIELGASFDALEGVSAVDNVDGILTESVTIEGTVDVAVAGTYVLTYRVEDARGNETTHERTVTVVAAADDADAEGDADGSGSDADAEGAADGSGSDADAEGAADGSGSDADAEGAADGSGSDADAEGTADGAGSGADGDGAADERPAFTPAAPVANGADLPAALEGVIGASVSGDVLSLTGLEPGAWAYAYGYSSPVGLGWALADADGQATLNLAGVLSAGEHRIAVLDADGELVGWSTVTVADAATDEDAASDDALLPTGAEQAGTVLAAGIAVLLLAAGAVLFWARRRAIS